MDVTISVISYNTRDVLKRCLKSIYEDIKGITFEVVVVDNGSNDKTLEMVRKEFPKVKLIANNKNLFFSKANNQALEIAKGRYFLILNSDTYFVDNSLKKMISFMDKNKEIGACEGLEVDQKGDLILTGSTNSTPLIDFYELSLLGKRIANPEMLRRYRLTNLKRDGIFEIDVGCDAFLLVRTAALKKINGYDQRFLLYYTENDLCLRIKKAGYKIFHFGKTKVVHEVSTTVKKMSFFKKLDIYYSDLWKYYWKNNHKILGTFLFLLLKIEKFILEIRENILLFSILTVAAFLRFYRLNELMPFIGDQGWFYLSARDMILYNNIPLVGITSSHTWLYQGPLWTYILGILFLIFNFNPIVPAYFTAGCGIFTVWLIYKIGKKMFSQKAGLIAAVSYASFPFIIINDRMPYHTSLIPLFSLLFVYAVFRWVSGEVRFFPLSVFFLAVLYNFELATQVFWAVVLGILVYGIWSKKMWSVDVFKKKLLLFSLLAFIIPMLPIIIYDFFHGFKQTIVFGLWIAYKMGKFLEVNKFSALIVIFFLSTLLAIVIRKKKILFFLNKILIGNTGIVVIIISIFIPFLGIYVNQQFSDAYKPVFFPTFVLIIGYFASLIFFNADNKYKKLIGCLFFITVLFVNSFLSIKNNFGMAKGYSFINRIEAAKNIIKNVDKREYNLEGAGFGSQFESFTMNYAYLTWWLGHGVSDKPQRLKFIIQEDLSGIHVSKLNYD